MNSPHRTGLPKDILTDKTRKAAYGDVSSVAESSRDSGGSDNLRISISSRSRPPAAPASGVAPAAKSEEDEGGDG